MQTEQIKVIQVIKLQATYKTVQCGAIEKQVFKCYEPIETVPFDRVFEMMTLEEIELAICKELDCDGVDLRTFEIKSN